MATPTAPRSWNTVPDRVLRPIRGVLTDIDDTLTRAGQIEPEAFAALQALAAAGWPVIAVTGRPVGWCLPFLATWPGTGIVAENGAVLLQRGHAGIEQRFFEPDQAVRAAQRQRLARCAAEILARVPGAHLADDSAGRLTDMAIDHSEHHCLGPTERQQVLALMQAHGLTATVSSIHINGWLGGHDKALGAAWAVPLLLGRPWVADEWLFVGDSPNDQALFAAVACSVGVANLRPHLASLHAGPAYLADGERGRGFAEVAQRLLARIS